MLKNFFTRFKYETVIVLSVAAVLLANYKPETFLSGWDNLQTELAPWLAVKRAFWAVWEEYQSFGLVAGNAHAADLVRAFIMYLASFVIPQSFIRYLFHALMLLTGGLGAFRLFKNMGMEKEKAPFAFFGSLFYMFNFGVIQLFFVPFEPFSIFFAALPWEIWIFLKTLRQPDRRNLLMFALVNLLATPQSYIQTIFVVYMIILGCFSFAAIKISFSPDTVKRSLVLFLLIIAVNSFWILPQLYFLKTNQSVVREAKINELSTGDLYYQNRETGNLQSFATLTGFYDNLFDAKYQPLFKDWQNHFSNPLIWILPYAIALIALYGLSYRNKFRLPFILLLFIAAVALLSSTVPFSWINDLLRRNDYLNQIFRSPFTKFIIPYSLAFSFFFMSGLARLAESRRLPSAYRSTQFATICFVLFLYCLPVFRGHFFSNSMKVTIPQDYFAVMDYFKGQDKNARIALLPEYTFWGWYFNRWGYDGSGFLWYGIEQPIVSRTFDIWSDKSEGYFWEMKAALEAEDITRFNALLDKYDISYLLLDKSLLPVTSTLKGMQYDRTNAILAKDPLVKEVMSGEHISLYRVMKKIPVKNFTASVDGMPNIGPAVKLTNEDTAYLKHGIYLTNPDLEYDYYYPFLDLMNQTVIPHRWSLEDAGQSFILSAKLNLNPADYSLIPSLVSNSVDLYDKKLVTHNSVFTTGLNGDTLSVTIDKSRVLAFKPSKTQINNCSSRLGRNERRGDGALTITSQGGAVACFNYNGNFLSQKYGYIIEVVNENIKGRRLFFYILDQTKKQSFLETRLDKDTQYFILNPKFAYGLGYNFTFQNNSYENLVSTNRLSAVNVYLFPYDDLKKISLAGRTVREVPTRYLNDFLSRKTSYFTYSVATASPPQNRYFILYQSFHPGWQAYRVADDSLVSRYLPFFNGTLLNTHIQVNNWANGWFIDKNNSNTSSPLLVTLVFWPQYLEFTGLALMLLAFILIALRRRHYQQ